MAEYCPSVPRKHRHIDKVGNSYPLKKRGFKKGLKSLVLKSLNKGVLNEAIEFRDIGDIKNSMRMVLCE